MRNTEQQKENRRYYLRNGKCPRCGGTNPLVEGRVLCFDCQKKHDDEQVERRARWREQGLCIRCGRERADGRMQCQNCLDNRRAKQVDAKSSQKWRDKNKMLGMCASCGKTWAEPGHVMCRKCLDKHNKYCRSPEQAEAAKKRRQARIEAGLCIDCGYPTENGKQRCPRCIEARKDSTRKYKIIQRIKREADRARGARV